MVLGEGDSSLGPLTILSPTLSPTPEQLSYGVAVKKLLFVAAGFSLRLHRRDACATCLIAIWYQQTVDNYQFKITDPD